MGDIVVLSVLVVIVGLIIYSSIKNHKKGKGGGCSCGCSGCAMSENCQSRKKVN